MPLKPPASARTLKQAAQLALDVQNACNLSGVLCAFNDIVMNTLWPIAHENNYGTDWVNQHPICTLFISKLDSLNHTSLDKKYDKNMIDSAHDQLMGEEMTFSHAYDEVEKLTKEDKLSSWR